MVMVFMREAEKARGRPFQNCCGLVPVPAYRGDGRLVLAMPMNPNSYSSEHVVHIGAVV